MAEEVCVTAETSAADIAADTETALTERLEREEIVLQAEGLTKLYKSRKTGFKKDFAALEDVSFTVRAGEVVGFLGPNGAGKSTAIKLITGLASMTSGKVSILGRDIVAERAKALECVGGVIEQPDLYLYMTGIEVMRYFAKFYPRSVYLTEENDKRTTKELTELRIEKLLKTVGLYERKEDQVKKYSLGMKQRLGIAQALINRPKLLILDEPTNGLDPAGIRQVRDIVVSLAKEMKMAVLVSSHQLAEMQQMCDRVIILSKGRKIAEGAMGDLISKQNNHRVVVKTKEPEKIREMLSDRTGLGFVTDAGGVTVTGDITAGEIAKRMVLLKIDMQGVQEEDGSLEELFLNMTEGAGNKNVF